MRKIWKRLFSMAVAVLAMTGLSCGAFATTSLARDVHMDDHYFDDAVFVGDSISLKLRNYVNKQRRRDPAFFGNAQFLTVGGLGSGNVQLPISSDSLHPSYNGQKMMLEDSVAATGAKKMYIMFGMNDIVPYGVDGAIENLETLIDKILEKSPDLTVAVESVTPILTDKQQRNLNNESISQYNEALQELCERRGFVYLDVASQLQDGDGGLVYEYCGDAPGLGMHLSDKGCAPWVSYLRSHPITDDEEPPESEEGDSLSSEEDGEGQADREEVLADDEEVVDEPSGDEDVYIDYDPDAEFDEDSTASAEASEIEEKPKGIRVIRRPKGLIYNMGREGNKS